MAGTITDLLSLWRVDPEQMNRLAIKFQSITIHNMSLPFQNQRRNPRCKGKTKNKDRTNS